MVKYNDPFYWGKDGCLSENLDKNLNSRQMLFCMILVSGQTGAFGQKVTVLN